MAARFYLPATSAAPAISPAVGTGWSGTATTGFVRRLGVTTKSATTLADHTSATGVATNPSTAVMRQYVIGPMAAQTISGSITGIIRGLESNAALNATVAINIRQVNSSGTHVNDLLAVSASDNTAASPPEFGTSAATRRLQDVNEATTLTLTSRTFSTGDYLVIELGFRKAATSTSQTVTLRFGDSAATDFAATDGLTTDLNPWVEFSGNLAFVRNLTAASAGVATANEVMNRQRNLTRTSAGAASVTTNLRGPVVTGIEFIAVAEGHSNDTFSTGTIDTTGATLLVACFTTPTRPWLPVLSDSKGNTWRMAIEYEIFSGSHVESVWYVENPTSVGTGHYITLTRDDAYCSAQFWAFKGTGSGVLAQAQPWANSSSTTITVGPIMPTIDGSLIIIYDEWDTLPSALPTASGGFSSPLVGYIGAGGAILGSGSTYLIQDTVATISPTVTSSDSRNHQAVSVIFNPAPAGTLAPAEEKPEDDYWFDRGNSLAADLKIWLPLLEGSGATLMDVAAPQQNGSILGTVDWTTSSPNGGSAVQLLTDNGQRITIGNRAAHQLSTAQFQPFTFSMWVKFANTTFGTKVLFNGGYFSDAPAMRWVGGGHLYYRYVAPDTTSASQIAFGGSGIAANTWCHIVFTDSGADTAGSVKCYLNGTALTIDTGETSYSGTGKSGNWDRNGDYGACFGGGAPFGDDWHPASWDSLMIFERELSSTEVTSLYNDPFSLLLIDVGGAGGPKNLTVSSAGQATVSATIYAAPAVIPLITLTDPFTDASINTGLWTSFGPVTETTSGLEISPATAGTPGGVRSVGPYDVTEHAVQVEIATRLTVAGTEQYLRVESDTSNGWAFGVRDGALIVRRQLAGTTTTQATASWPSGTKYLRVWETDNLLIFDYSTDGTAWTTFHVGAL